ncbi:DUF2167 domain-containing protein [Luteolibacter sp. SL250]|uniref:DUF2167 domain-containing protein n=1 Tax=Luteolibacter sp. SL250 TaxID=2995170 RepID=UPI00226EC873|nr:DUF2167 domain-containing protein [Luteolibacter sp. SL250]WAC19298.1 DUF2167 domain-containing protein [Luteolibacter sp. SL250]
MSLSKLVPLFGIFSLALSIPGTAQPAAPEAPAQEQAAPQGANPFVQLVESLNWTTSGEAGVGHQATIKVPEGYRFTGQPGSSKLMEFYGNLTNGKELGYLTPEDFSWFAVFTFSDVGYVKDDEKDKLDADKILEDMRKGQEQANAELSRRGMSPLTILGWQTPPFYNPETNNLEWAIRLSSTEGQVVNYRTKILGRRGVMDVVLVCDESQLATVVPEYQKLLGGFAYKKEESYASFQKGDKIAEYGLTGLIVGGTLLAAAKTGLLSKLGQFLKPILIGVAAIFAGIAKLFGFKKKKESV